MIKNTYAKAYTEVLEIISNLPREEYAKIPKEEIDFYRNNMDKNYNFTINPEINLSEQNISKEANAIIVNIFQDYFATEEQKIKIKEILKLNQEKEEKAKREKYNSNSIFLKTDQNTNVETSENNEETKLIEYKETFLTKFKNFIFKILRINK